jgi:hypothetical protein
MEIWFLSYYCLFAHHTIIFKVPGARVLYLGAASGTSVSHVSDIVGPVSWLNIHAPSPLPWVVYRLFPFNVLLAGMILSFPVICDRRE